MSVRLVEINFDTNASEVAKEQAMLKEGLKDTTKATEDAEEANEEYTSSLADTIKDTRVFGISIGGIKSAMTGAIRTIRGAVIALKSFKVALAATGIGIIVIALGSLVALLTQTQGGLDLVSKAFNAIKTIMNVVIDRLIYIPGPGTVKGFRINYKVKGRA